MNEPAADDGGDPTSMTEEELYVVVRSAVTDALFDVLVTVFLLGLGLVFLWAGIQGLLQGSYGIELVFTGGILGLGLVLIAAAFDLVPSFHEKLVG